ncbi:unnamed protein product, partial [Rhizoctonia solani]
MPTLHTGSKSRVMVIAGGNGFLGLRLARFYHARNFHVRIADIRPPPEDSTRRYYTESLVGNLCDLDFCKYVVRGAEVILHCAETKYEVDSPYSDFGMTNYRANHTMTQNLLASAHQTGVKTFFYASTQFDPAQRQPFDDQGNDPLTRFGPGNRELCKLEKLHSEQLVLHYSNRMTIHIARFDCIYDPTESWDHWDDNGPVTLVRRFLAAKHLINLGVRPRVELAAEVTQKRQFIYIEEAVKAVASAIDSAEVKNPYIVLPDQPISTLELASLALKVVGLDPSDVDIVHDDRVIDFDGFDLTPGQDSATQSSIILASYQRGLVQLRDSIEATIHARLLNQKLKDSRTYLMSLLSHTSANGKPQSLVKFAIILALSSHPSSGSIFDDLRKFARSLQDTSWRDRNELGADQYSLSIYLAFDIDDDPDFPSSPPHANHAELIFHQHGFFQVFITPCHILKGTPNAALNDAARRAYADRCDYHAIMDYTTELLDEGWMRLTHAQLKDTSLDSGGPNGFGCVALIDSICSGMPRLPVVHCTHMDIFEGKLIPEDLYDQDANIYLFQLYRHFGVASTIPVQVQGSGGIIYGEKGSRDWSFDTFEGSKARVRVWAEQNSQHIQPKMSLDVVIPSYRVSLERLSRVLALKSSSTCITTFIIVVDNPRSPHADILKHSNSHRTDVCILVNKSNIGASASRNKGLAASTAEWVAFLDDDVDPSPNYLVAAEQYIRNQPNAAGFVGNTYFPTSHNIFTTAVRLSGVTFFWDIADKIAENVPWGITANLIVRRNIRDQVTFDLRFPKTGGGEDIDFCINKRKASLERGGLGFSAAPGVTVTHPWWNEGRRSYTRFFNWARGDGGLIKMHPDLSWYDVTSNSAETFLLAALSISAGLLAFSWSMIRFGIILAVSNLAAHVLHDAHRHVVRQKTQYTAQTPLGHVRWSFAICEGALIRMVSEMG